MSWRRDGDKAKAWSKWRHEQAVFIARSSVPDFIVESRANWLRFLDHGYLEECGPPSHFDYDVRNLTHAEQEKVLELIETYPGGAESYAARRLRQLITGAE